MTLSRTFEARLAVVAAESPPQSAMMPAVQVAPVEEEKEPSPDDEVFWKDTAFLGCGNLTNLNLSWKLQGPAT